MEDIILCLLGVAGGLLVSGGVFTALLAVGLTPRFAEKTETMDYISWYETCIVLGTLVGTILSVYSGKMQWTVACLHGAWGDVSLSIIGFFMGCFVGCLALAIAEMLDSIPIFARRIGFRKGLGIVICFVALGKAIGSLVYFGIGIH